MSVFFFSLQTPFAAEWLEAVLDITRVMNKFGEPMPQAFWHSKFTQVGWVGTCCAGARFVVPRGHGSLQRAAGGLTAGGKLLRVVHGFFSFRLRVGKEIERDRGREVEEFAGLPQ